MGCRPAVKIILGISQEGGGKPQEPEMPVKKSIFTLISSNRPYVVRIEFFYLRCALPLRYYQSCPWKRRSSYSAARERNLICHRSSRCGFDTGVVRRATKTYKIMKTSLTFAFQLRYHLSSTIPHYLCFTCITIASRRSCIG
jgi:hypothetical protein